MAKKKPDTEEVVARKIERQANKLLADNDLEGIRDMFAQAFGRPFTGTDETKAAVELATFLVTGAKGAPAKGELSPEREAAVVRGILDRVREAWERVEQLTEAKKAELSELKLTIDSSKDRIAAVLKDDGLADAERLSRVEVAWQTLRRTEQKRAEVSQEFTQRIRAAKQAIRGEIENARQLPLFEATS